MEVITIIKYKSFFENNWKMPYGVDKVARWVKELETNPDVLSSIPSDLQGKRKEPTPETFLCTRWHVNKSPRTQCTQTHKMMVYRFCMYKQGLQKSKCFWVLNWKERDLFIYFYFYFICCTCARVREFAYALARVPRSTRRSQRTSFGSRLSHSAVGSTYQT